MKPTIIDGPRMSDISEPSEVLVLKEFLKRSFDTERRIIGVHLWTHSPRRLMHNHHLLEVLRQLVRRGIPVALQITITGLGGTLIEPGIEPAGTAFDHVGLLLDQELLSPDRICIRLDPLQSWLHPSGNLSSSDNMERILEKALSLKIRRIRTSLLAFSRYRSKISPRMTSRNLTMGEINLNHIGQTLRTFIDRGLDIRSCVSDLSRIGIPPGGCFDFTWITGLPLLGPTQPVAPRGGCLCVYPGYATLWKVPRRSDCRGRCLACYAQEHH